LENFGNIDSKYRYVILAAKRAKQLLKGAKPKIKAKSRSLIRIAQIEVQSGLIDFELIPPGKEDVPEPDERVFVGAAIAADEPGEPEPAAGKEAEEEGPVKGAGDEAEEEESGEEESEEEESGEDHGEGLKPDQDE
jgi:DNA-directed RNA polymerase subunit omega